MLAICIRVLTLRVMRVGDIVRARAGERVDGKWLEVVMCAVKCEWREKRLLSFHIQTIFDIVSYTNTSL